MSALMTNNLWSSFGFEHNKGTIGDKTTTSKYYFVLNIPIYDEEICHKINTLDKNLNYIDGTLNYHEFINHDIPVSVIVEAIRLIHYYGGFGLGQIDIKEKVKKIII